jgi:hypothetical protein
MKKTTLITNFQISELDNYQATANQLPGYEIKQEAFCVSKTKLKNYHSLHSSNSDCSDFWETLKEIRKAKKP